MASLKEIRGIAISILTGQSAGQEVIMGALDRLEEKPEGSLSAAADKLALQLAQRMKVIQRGNHEEAHKKGK
jgi:rRNA-processing protein FCF1